MSNSDFLYCQYRLNQTSDFNGEKLRPIPIYSIHQAKPKPAITNKRLFSKTLIPIDEDVYNKFAISARGTNFLGCDLHYRKVFIQDSCQEMAANNWDGETELRQGCAIEEPGLG